MDLCCKSSDPPPTAPRDPRPGPREQRHKHQATELLLAAFLLWMPAPLARCQAAGANAPLTWADRLGDPAGLAERAGGYGTALHYQYVHDLSTGPPGTSQKRNWFGRYTWTLSASVDLQKAAGWSGASFYASMKQHVLEFGRVDDSVAQGYSNLDASPHTTLYEAWIQQQTFGGRLTLKAGRMDSNVDFDAVPTAADFLNSSMGYSPTLMDFPSYPAPQPAVELLATVNNATRLAAGEFKSPNGSIALLEANRAWRRGMDLHGGRMAIGTWHLTATLPRFDRDASSGTGGLYGVLEQSLWTRSPAHGDARSLAGYLQAGSGDEQVNPFGGHLGGGLVLSAPLARRPADAAGIAASWVRISGGKSETVLESYYRLRLGRVLSLVPDVQYFIDPAGTRSPREFVATPRLVIAF
jgi:porin